MKRFPAHAAPARPERPSTVLLHDTPDVRVVAFHLQAGQEVKPHRSPSTVLLQVVEGEGEFSGADGVVHLSAGESVVYERNEMHGIRALDVPLRFHAIITPRPS